MFRLIIFFVLAFALLALPVLAQEEGPPISITSPDTDSTFALGSIKSRSLFWDGKAKMLFARVTFVDSQDDHGQANEDSHSYRLPGITFDQARGIFTATTKKGEVIPVAHFKKVLFVKSIESTPNAVVRIVHPRGGNVTVILEAISPTDPAMQPAPKKPGENTISNDKLLR